MFWINKPSSCSVAGLPNVDWFVKAAFYMQKSPKCMLYDEDDIKKIFFTFSLLDLNQNVKHFHRCQIFLQRCSLPIDFFFFGVGCCSSTSTEWITYRAALKGQTQWVKHQNPHIPKVVRFGTEVPFLSKTLLRLFVNKYHFPFHFFKISSLAYSCLFKYPYL